MSDSHPTRLGQAIENLMECLPEGFQVSMHLVSGQGVVVLYGPEGQSLPIESKSEDIAGLLTDALYQAVGRDKSATH